MKRPLIDSGPVSEFGEADLSYVEDQNHDLSEDMMYVPGFSDDRRRRELHVKEWKEGTRATADVAPPLKGNVYWTRCTSIGGTADARKLMGARNAGYRPITAADIGDGKVVTGMGSGWQTLPDGSIRNAAGDYQLMILEGQAAANRAKAKEARWTSQSAQLTEQTREAGIDPDYRVKAGGREIMGKADDKGVIRSIVDTVRKKMDGGV